MSVEIYIMCSCHLDYYQKHKIHPCDSYERTFFFGLLLIELSLAQICHPSNLHCWIEIWKNGAHPTCNPSLFRPRSSSQVGWIFQGPIVRAVQIQLTRMPVLHSKRRQEGKRGYSQPGLIELSAHSGYKIIKLTQMCQKERRTQNFGIPLPKNILW